MRFELSRIRGPRVSRAILSARPRDVSARCSLIRVENIFARSEGIAREIRGQVAESERERRDGGRG